MFNEVFYVSSGFAVYCFYFAEKMDDFHFGLVKLEDNLQSLPSLMLVVGSFVFLKTNISGYARDGLFVCGLFT